jgi:hypothetical protein
MRYVTGPRLAGETGGGLGLRPRPSTGKVLASTTTDRYLPAGAAAPGGPGAAFAAKCPRIVTRNTGTPSAPGTKSPGVAEVIAFAGVVSTAVIHNGAESPSAFATRLPITVSRDIAGPGTGEPAPAGDPAQPATASPDTTASTHASAAAARASGRAAVSG